MKYGKLAYEDQAEQFVLPHQTNIRIQLLRIGSYSCAT
jgi:hypothetical protein